MSSVGLGKKCSCHVRICLLSCWFQSNFRTAKDWGLPHRVLKTHGAKVAHLPASVDVPLPPSFVWKGRTMDMQQFLHEQNTTGLVILKIDGPTKARVLREEYHLGNEANHTVISWSLVKSFVSAAFGIAVSEGFIKDIEKETVTDYVPSLRGSGYDGVRLKDVLQMSSGGALCLFSVLYEQVCP